VRAGKSYVDVGTVYGYRQAMHLLAALPTVTQVPMPVRGVAS
jgi:hypothetical protein